MKGLYKIILFAAVFALFSSNIVYSIPVFADDEDDEDEKEFAIIPPLVRMRPSPLEDFEPGELLVGLKEYDEEFEREVDDDEIDVLDELDDNELFLLKVPQEREDDYIEILKKNPKVKYAEKNFIVRALTNDSYWSYQWDMRIIDADKAWQTQTGDNSVIVAVVDTGVDYNHPDLVPRVTKGYDYAYGDNNPMDGDGHGTHVAGTVGATLNNNRGVAGLSQVEIHAIKVLDDTGSGFISDVASGIIDAADYGADVINLSLGCYCPSEALEDAIVYATDKGSLVIAAAGNDNTDSILYPAGYDDVVAVTATDRNDGIASYSNFGDWIELSAPGGDIKGGHYSQTYVLSTWPNNNYVFSAGTSMAAPHVSGVAALIKSQDSSMTNNQIRERLWNTADDLGDPEWDEFYGYGRVNAFTAISTLPGTAPPPPLPSISIGNVALDEGNSGTTSFVFTVTRSGDTSGSSSVSFTTADGSAFATSDYTSTSGTASFGPGDIQTTVTVNVSGDTAVESDETFTVDLSSPVGATIVDSQGLGTIQNDDTAPPPPLPSISIGNVALDEGNSGTTSFVFTVTRSGDTSGSSSVSFTTADGSAFATSDYTSTSGTASFGPGDIQTTVTVNVSGDTAVESDETFTVDLSSPVGATIVDSQGLGTIQNDDTAPPAAPVVTQPASPTNDNTPTITGTGENGAIVTLTSDLDGTLSPTATVSGGVWSITLATVLQDGTHSLTATQTDAAGNVSPASAAITITVDTTAPPTPSITTIFEVSNGYDLKNEKTLEDDGKTYVVKARDNESWETEFGFWTSYQFEPSPPTDIIPAGATISSVKIYVDHYEEEEFGNGNIMWSVGTGWSKTPDNDPWDSTKDIPIHQEEQNVPADSWIPQVNFDWTPKIVNSLELKIENLDNLEEKKILVDYIKVEVEWTG